jgi:NAD-dependent dihydropyrimidine dehydrogenase PreA subunit
MKGFHYLDDVATLKLETETCIGCGRCLEVCPHQVFALEENKAVLVRFDDCMECGACAMNCPVSAIFVDAGVGCAAGLFIGWFRDRKQLLLGGKCC